MDSWNKRNAEVVKTAIPYNPGGPYKHLFVGNPSPASQDYRAILDGNWRWANLEAASAAAVEALPFADGWYVSYETGMNVFSSESFRAPWEWYLGDMVRRLRAVKDVPIIWSPYLFGNVSLPAVNGWAQTMRAVKEYYSPGAQLEVHVQDGVGSGIQTASSAISWIQAMKSKNVVPVKVNVEWFRASDFMAADGRSREATYKAHGLEIGACWEARYWYRILNQPVSDDTLIREYILRVSPKPKGGEAPNNRAHADDTFGPYFDRAKYVTQWGKNLIVQFPGLFSLGQWRALGVTPKPGDGRSPNSDHYSGGAYDFGGPRSLLEQALAVVRTDQTVSFAKVHGAPLHLHVSFKI
jgi:hypothetical protein